MSPEVRERKRQIALKNLAKARTIVTDEDSSTNKSTPSTLKSTPLTGKSTLKSTSTSTQGTREQVEECTKELMSTLGDQLRVLSKGTSSSVLKSAYAYKGLVDTYLNLQKAVYPQGIGREGTNHLTQLLGSVLPDLKNMLRVNINIGIDPANATSVPLVPPSERPPPIECTPHVVDESTSEH